MSGPISGQPMQPAQQQEHYYDANSGMFYDPEHGWYQLNQQTGERYYYQQPQQPHVAIPPEEPEPELPTEDTPNKAAALATYWDIRTPTERELARAGFTPVDMPQYTYPKIDPRSLQNSSGREIGEMHARIGGWLNYAEYTLADIESHLIAINRELSQLLDYRLEELGVEINQSTGKPYSVADRKAKAERTPRYQQLLKIQTTLEAKRIKVKSYVKGFERDSSLVSRHITLRMGLNEHERAADGMPYRGRNSTGMR